MRAAPLTGRTLGVVTLAGLGLTLGLTAFLSRVTAGSLAEIRRAQKCTVFLSHGTDTQYSTDVTDAQGVKLTLYRSKAFWEDVDQLKAHKKWIGAVDLVDANTTSRAFPGLTNPYRGCLEFKAGRNVPGSGVHAQLYDSRGSLEEYEGRWVCPVESHKPDATPAWAVYPDDCDNEGTFWLTTSQGEITNENLVRSASAPVQMSTLMAQVKRLLDDKQVPAAEQTRIMAAMAAPGPWYPCAETGCCRAFSY